MASMRPHSTASGKGGATRLTPELIGQIASGVEQGVEPKDVAAILGISYYVFKEWIERGENRHPSRPTRGIYLDLVAALRKARAIFAARAVKKIVDAANGGAAINKKTTRIVEDGKVVSEVEETKLATPNWRAAAWLLESNYSEYFGRQGHVPVPGQQADSSTAYEGPAFQVILEDCPGPLQEIAQSISQS